MTSRTNTRRRTSRRLPLWFLPLIPLTLWLTASAGIDFLDAASGRAPAANEEQATRGDAEPTTAASSSGHLTPDELAQAHGQLEDLTVKGRAPKTGYSREQFGDGWADLDNDSCLTRDAILTRDLTDVRLEPDSPCVVAAGTLHDPYTGDTIEFRRGTDTSTAVQIDHVVALSDAWQKGAQAWTPRQRERFANDPANLLAVDGPTNAAKGDGDAATWLPPNKPVRCSYVAQQVRVKHTYALTVTPAEHDAIARVLATCSR